MITKWEIKEVLQRFRMYCIPPTYLKVLERKGEEEDLEWIKMYAKEGLYRYSILGAKVFIIIFNFKTKIVTS